MYFNFFLSPSIFRACCGGILVWNHYVVECLNMYLLVSDERKAWKYMTSKRILRRNYMSCTYIRVYVYEHFCLSHYSFIMVMNLQVTKYNALTQYSVLIVLNLKYILKNILLYILYFDSSHFSLDFI